jgi:hypothetical protein
MSQKRLNVYLLLSKRACMNFITFKSWFKSMSNACYLRKAASKVKQFVIKVAECHTKMSTHNVQELLSISFFKTFYVLYLVSFFKNTLPCYIWTIFCIFSSVGNWYNYIELVCKEVKILICLHFATLTTN